MVELARHVRTTIRYDGPALSDHEMDVRDLAPALLALADIIHFANKRFNGDAADMRVLVNADVEQRCFMLDLSLVQSLLEQAKGFFGSDHVKTAKEIAEWIGLAGGGAVSLFKLIHFIGKRGEAGTTIDVAQNGDGNIVINGDGNTIIVPPAVYQLAQDPQIVDRAKEVVKPLQKPGYRSLSFIDGDRETFEISAEDASSFMAATPAPPDTLPTESVSQIRGGVRIKSPQYEGTAKWSLLWNGRAIDAEMAEAAADWVKSFQANQVSAPPNSVLEVSMTETVKLDDKGLAVGKPTYVVREVHAVMPPLQQGGLFDRP